MKLEAGKRYVMVNGEVTGEMIEKKGWFMTEKLVDGFIPIWNPDGSADFFFEYYLINEQFHIVKEYEE